MTEKTRLLARHIIGPHPINILSIFYGSLLGDAHLDQGAGNVRISFQQESTNLEYLM